MIGLGALKGLGCALLRVFKASVDPCSVFGALNFEDSGSKGSPDRGRAVSVCSCGKCGCLVTRLACTYLLIVRT